jgi:predicted secreted protein
MAVLKGVSGNIKLTTNTIAEMSNWELSVESEFVDTTSFGDSAREQTPTFITWSGTASGKLDISDTNGHVAIRTALLAGSTVDARFYVDATHYFSGTAYVSASFSAAVDNVIEASYTFTAAGALSYT